MCTCVSIPPFYLLRVPRSSITPGSMSTLVLRSQCLTTNQLCVNKEPIKDEVGKVQDEPGTSCTTK